jgi:hypothetical protein
MCYVRLLGGKENNVQAQAVNDGIVYLMAIPLFWLQELVMVCIE